MADLKKSKNNFDQSRLIGRRVHVCKGVLQHNNASDYYEVALKRFDAKDIQELKEFRNVLGILYSR